MKKKTIKIPSLDSKVFVYIGDESSCANRTEKDGYEWSDYQAAVTIKFGINAEIVFDEEQIKPEYIYHEALHAAWYKIGRAHV